MEEPDMENMENRSSFTRADRSSLLILLVFALGLRCWQLPHAEVLARDSVNFIRIAWQLEHDDWKEVLKRANQHPLYPAAVATLSQIIRPWYPDDLPRAMQLSA